MLTGAELSRFRRKLLNWFADFQRDLPWRRTSDPYHIWLSEVMLQQTRVAAAIPYYESFLRRFPDIRMLAAAPEEEVLRHWAGLGYYSRARNLQKAARQIVTEHGARFPDTPQKALALSGVGAYSAAAILSIAYGKKLAVLDGNVARVIARLGVIRGDLRSNGRWQALQSTADRLLAPQAPGNWNQAMMELGALVCTPRSPQCLVCPVTEFCQARKAGLVDVIPEKRNKQAAVEIILAALVLLDSRGRTLLLSPRSAVGKSTVTQDVGVLLSRMWHFPTIPVQKNPEEELRWFAERTLSISKKGPASFQPLAKVRHTVTYRRITVLPFRAQVRKLPAIADGQVLGLDQLSAVAVSNLTRKVALAALAMEENSGKSGTVKQTALLC